MKILIQLFLRLLHEKTPYHTLCTIPEAVKLRGSSLLMKLLTKLFLKLPTQLRIKLLTSEAFVTPSPRHSAGSPSEEESSPSCGLKRGPRCFAGNHDGRFPFGVPFHQPETKG